MIVRPIWSTYLEDSEKCDGKGVEVRGRRTRFKIELTAEELHAE